MYVSRPAIRDGLTALLFLGAVAWVFSGSGWVFLSHSENSPNREALVRLHQEIRLGASDDEVRESYRRHATARLRLHEGGTGEWWIGMPMEFGGGDWTLRIGLQDSRVVRVRMRTMNGPPPPDGPVDKPVPGA